MSYLKICPVCKNTETKVIKIVSSKFCKCSKCNHIFSYLEKQNQIDIYKKILLKTLHIKYNNIIDSFDTHFMKDKYFSPLQNIISHLHKDDKILDTNTLSGYRVKELRKYFNFVHGKNNNNLDIFDAYLENNNIQYDKNEKYNKILIFDGLSNSFCLYSHMSSIFNLCDLNNNKIFIRQNIYIDKNYDLSDYFGMSHIFSKDSFFTFIDNMIDSYDILFSNDKSILVCFNF